MRLTEACAQKTYRIVSLEMPHATIKHRLMEMGWVKGTPLRILKVGAGQRFVYVRLRGYDLSLSRSVAQYIYVKSLQMGG